MPTIEITQEQADALARGRDITIAPKPPRNEYVILGVWGSVWEVSTPDPLPIGHSHGLTATGNVRCVRARNHAPFRAGDAFSRMDFPKGCYVVEAL